MTKAQIAVALFHMKRDKTNIGEVSGQLTSADELLRMFFGRMILPDEGLQWIAEDNGTNLSKR